MYDCVSSTRHSIRIRPEQDCESERASFGVRVRMRCICMLLIYDEGGFFYMYVLQ